jgi:hypothetical protein
MHVLSHHAHCYICRNSELACKWSSPSTTWWSLTMSLHLQMEAWSSLFLLDNAIVPLDIYTQHVNSWKMWKLSSFFIKWANVYCRFVASSVPNYLWTCHGFSFSVDRFLLLYNIYQDCIKKMIVSKAKTTNNLGWSWGSRKLKHARTYTYMHYYIYIYISWYPARCCGTFQTKF